MAEPPAGHAETLGQRRRNVRTRTPEPPENSARAVCQNRRIYGLNPRRAHPTSERADNNEQRRNNRINPKKNKKNEQQNIDGQSALHSGFSEKRS